MGEGTRRADKAWLEEELLLCCAAVRCGACAALSALVLWVGFVLGIGMVVLAVLLTGRGWLMSARCPRCRFGQVGER